MQDVVDPIIDEMLAKFVVDSHFKSQPKGANIDDKPVGESEEDNQASAGPVDPEVQYFRYHLVFLLVASRFVSTWSSAS